MLFLFLIGCWTRTTSILAAVITISYAHRSAGVLFGLDQVSSLLLLYLAIGPSGAAYSVDRWRALRRGRSSRGQPRIDANLAIRLIQLHMCLIYLVAGLGKLLGETWWAGTALWGAFANFEYQTIDMTWLAWHPLLVNLVTHTILFWEISYCVLVWPRLIRPLILALAIPLHLGIALSMGMMSFGLVMLVGNLAFVSPAVVRNHPGRPVAFDSGAGQGGSLRGLREPGADPLQQPSRTAYTEAFCAATRAASGRDESRLRHQSAQERALSREVPDLCRSSWPMNRATIHKGKGRRKSCLKAWLSLVPPERWVV